MTVQTAPESALKGTDALQSFRDAHARFWAHSRECARCLEGNAGLSYRQQARGAGCPEAWPLFKELQRAQIRAYA